MTSHILTSQNTDVRMLGVSARGYEVYIGYVISIRLSLSGLSIFMLAMLLCLWDIYSGTLYLDKTVAFAM